MVPGHMVGVTTKILSGQFPITGDDPPMYATYNFYAAFAAVEKAIQVPSHLTQIIQ
jgi:hypothetical protein